MNNPLQVTMLGGFSIRHGEKSIDDSSNRTRKVWLLLAYLIYSRNTQVKQSQLTNLVCGDSSEDVENPAGRLKALLYRARTQLNHLGTDVGHLLIVNKNGSYCWNNDLPLELDVEQFDALCRSAAAARTEEEKLALYLQALPLYRGDFLPKLSMESWVMPINAYFHQLYLQGVEYALAQLTAQMRWAEADEICRQALQIEPYSETLYQYKMRCLIAREKRADALTVYEKMSELLFDTFGVMPSEESRQLYREAAKTVNTQAASIVAVREQLQEVDGSNGAVFCEFDFFRLLYQVQARAIIRSGDVVHIALISCHGQDDKPLPQRSLNTAMENLQKLMLSNLRQGDVVTRYSASQLCCMLPNANYENSCAVCQRIVKAFYRQYPHTPAQLHYRVQPLEPTVLDR